MVQAIATHAPWGDGYVTDVPYVSEFHREATPAEMLLALRCRGLRAPDADAPLSYLELGCGDGRTLNALAAASPHLTFVGVDFNPTHILRARAEATAAGLRNVRYLERSFEALLATDAFAGGPDRFDLVVLHGVYAWVSDKNRAALRRVLLRRVATGGVLLVDYNTRVGWAAVAPAQRLMREVARRGQGSAIDRLEQAMEVLKQLREASAEYFHHNAEADRWLDRIQTEPKPYLAHEYLNDTWRPMDHLEVAADMSEARLTAACSASLIEHFDDLTVPDRCRPLLERTTDPGVRAVLADYAGARRFNSELYVRGLVELSPAARVEALCQLRFSLLRSPEACAMQDVMVPAGRCDLPADVYGPVLMGLSLGPHTATELMKMPPVAALGLPQVLDALAVLCGLRYAAPALAEEGLSERRLVADQFNDAALGEAARNGTGALLASPVIGGGVSIGPLFALFLACARAEHPEPATYAWQVMQIRGERLNRAGAPLETAEENLAELQARSAEFTRRERPVLAQLGLC